MNYYRTHTGRVFDISEFDWDERRVFTRLMQEYGSGQAKSWQTFQGAWEKTTSVLAQQRKKKPETYELTIIAADLARNVGIQNGELKGTISAMLE